MAKGQPYIGDRPTLIVTIHDQDGAVVDVSAASVRQILIRPPNGAEIAKTASLVTDGKDGQIQYVIEDGLLDSAGLWRYLGYVVIGGKPFTGGDVDGRPLTFQVRDF